MQVLASRIKARLAHKKFCLVFDGDLDRCWPLPVDKKKGKRQEAIREFAAKNGWSATFHDPGVRVTFRKLP